MAGHMQHPGAPHTLQDLHRGLGALAQRHTKSGGHLRSFRFGSFQGLPPPEGGIGKHQRLAGRFSCLICGEQVATAGEQPHLQPRGQPAPAGGQGRQGRERKAVQFSVGGEEPLAVAGEVGLQGREDPIGQGGPEPLAAWALVAGGGQRFCDLRVEIGRAGPDPPR